jgi:hypothetical protein
MSRKQPALQRTTKKGCPGPDNRKWLSRILHELAGRFLHRPSTRYVLRALRAALPLFRASRRMAFFVRRYRLAAAVHQLFSVPENRKPRTVVSRRQAGGNPRGIERVTNCVRHPHSTDSTVALPTTGRLELGASVTRPRARQRLSEPVFYDVISSSRPDDLFCNLHIYSLFYTLPRCHAGLEIDGDRHHALS